MSTVTPTTRARRRQAADRRACRGRRRLTISNPAQAQRARPPDPRRDHAPRSPSWRPESRATRCVVVTGAHGMFSAGYDIGEIPDEEFEERAERLVAHPFTEAIDALRGLPVPDARGAARPHDRRRPGARAGLRPARGPAGHQAGHAARRSSGWCTRTPACAASSTRSARRARASCSCSAATSTRPPRSRGAWSTASRPADELDAVALELASELAGNAPLSQLGNKRVIARAAARRGRAGARGRRGADRAAPRLVRLAGHARGNAGLRRETSARAGAAR